MLDAKDLMKSQPQVLGTTGANMNASNLRRF